MLDSLLAFIATILIIVAFHEYGHFLCMRLFGVRILTYSIGFGPRLLHWTSKKTGTDYVLAAIPLGGYVKPYDSRAEGKLLEGGQEGAEGLDEEDFAKKPAWQRFLTYAAGPFANFVLAFIFYWLISVHGQLGMAPNVSQVAPQSVAATAGVQPGDQVEAINGNKVTTWQQATMVLLGQVGSDQPAALTVKRQGQPVDISLPLGKWASNPQQSPLTALGITPKAPSATLGDIIAGSAAEQAGLRQGDVVRQVNKQPIDSWSDWVKVVRASPNKALNVTVSRQDQLLTLSLTPAAIQSEDKTIGRAGVMLGGLTLTQYGPLQAIPAAWHKLWQETGMIVSATWQLVAGNLSLKALGGPITIAEAAGDTAAVGIVVFLGFLAFFSISLGVLNLLPIPMLDGGWMVFCVIEGVMRRQLSEKFLVWTQGIGFSLVMALMALAIYNDLIRQFG